MGLPLVKAEPALSVLLGPIEERLIDGHVGPAGAGHFINPQ
jgi:hypothetical protein